MPKCEITLRFGIGVLLVHIFRTPFPKNTSGGQLLRGVKNVHTLPLLSCKSRMLVKENLDREKCLAI